MRPDEFDANAFQAKALSLHRAFEQACARATEHLRNATACPPGDPTRYAFVTSAREDVHAARLALREDAALFASFFTATAAPEHIERSEALIIEFETRIDALSPQPGS